jgi:hypothetical protein
VQQACLGPPRADASPTSSTLVQILHKSLHELLLHVPLLCAQGCTVGKQLCVKAEGSLENGRGSG